MIQRLDNGIKIDMCECYTFIKALWVVEIELFCNRLL